MHNLEVFADGTAAFVSARQTPWHKLGTVTADTMTAAEAIKLAHLDWEVTKQPILAAYTHPAQITEDGVTPERVELVPVKDKFATVRIHPKTGQVDPLGVVGNTYVPFQNEQTALVLDAIVQQGGANIETMGAIANGRHVFASIKMPSDTLIGGRDVVDQWLVVRNSHDGLSKLRVTATPIRPVCRNTLELGEQLAAASVSMRHTISNVEEAAEFARAALGITSKFVEEFEALAAKLVSEPFTRSEFGSLVDKVWEPTLTEKGVETPGTIKRRAALFGLWVSDTQANIAGTKWAAYNAVVEYADWIAPARGGDTGRASKIALGLAAEPKAKAARLLTA